MKKAFTIISLLVLNFHCIDLFSKPENTTYVSKNTGGSYSNYWCKIASVTIVSGYQDNATTLELLANGTSNSRIYWGKLIIRCKRQNSDPNGSPTDFQMHLYSSNLGSEIVKGIQNHNVVDVYVRIPNSWTRLYFRSLIDAGSIFQFYDNQPLLQNLPSGNVYICKEGDMVSEKITAKNIEATEIKINQSFWSDFVFKPDYKLRSLEEVEKHISQNGHLPDIPSAAEFKENGVGLGEMDDMLLRKVEELTLYVIEQNKSNKKLLGRIEELQTENQRQSKEIQSLKSKIK
jgi:hypothetical protein